ncbi:hypothetical protein E6O75_ATG02448 [Venturia nashicola]|uniref:Uncharacterized protein n=1 Tax=Venturia nashicola TaxID=86259 RepID=A0A4Z1P531_9PEZI|nr:hypothetical protein E6O75_ATG02448 [Venturia nashicola]
MNRLAVPVLLALSALISAAPIQAGHAAVNDAATPTAACSTPTPVDNNLLSNEHQEESLPCIQQRFKKDEPPWGNGVPPMMTILPGPPVFSDKEACKTNHKLLNQMEDKFMKDLARARKDKPFDYHQPTFTVRAGACVTTDYRGPADKLDRYRKYSNNNPPVPASAGGYGGWNGGQQQGASQPGSQPANNQWNGNQPQEGSRNAPPPQPNNPQTWRPPPRSQQSGSLPNSGQSWAPPSGGPPSAWGQTPQPAIWGGSPSSPEPPFQSSRAGSAQPNWEPQPKPQQQPPPFPQQGNSPPFPQQSNSPPGNWEAVPSPPQNTNPLPTYNATRHPSSNQPQASPQPHPQPKPPSPPQPEQQSTQPSSPPSDPQPQPSSPPSSESPEQALEQSPQPNWQIDPDWSGRF